MNRKLELMELEDGGNSNSSGGNQEIPSWRWPTTQTYARLINCSN